MRELLAMSRPIEPNGVFGGSPGQYGRKQTMLLDNSRFPLVFAREQGDPGASILDQLEALLDRQAPFVLITDHSPEDHGDETPEERREKALFFKKVRDRFRKYCRAMIVIENGKPTNAAVRVAAATAAKAFGFSVLFEADEEQAVAKGMSLLENDAAKPG
ncbi:hypothetical protein [Phyllobacterium phragmitis]